jgi:hypothetical protein
MVTGYINGMEIYYRTLCGKGAPLGSYFVTVELIIVLVEVASNVIVILNYTNTNTTNYNYIVIAAIVVVVIVLATYYALEYGTAYYYIVLLAVDIPFDIL